MRFQAVEEGVRIAVDSVRANRLRSGLTILGVAIGVSVVVTMAALITGIRSSVLQGFEAAGPRNFIVTRFDMTNVRLVNGPGRPPWWNLPKVTPEEARRIGRLPGVRESVVSVDFNVTMAYRGLRISDVASRATSEGWPSYSVGTFTAGRNFLASDVRQARSVVVISKRLSDDLFGPLDPIGRQVRVSSGDAANELFTVVGVFEPEQQIFSDAVPNLAVFPYTTAFKRLKASDEFLAVLVVPADSARQQAVMDRVVGALRSMRGLRPEEANNFSVLRSDQLVELFDRITGVFFLVMLALSSVALMVGGVGVIGIMMISVTERTREIGIRKSVGATRREILWQFLVEAAALTLAGGGVGLVLGAAAAETFSRYTPIPARIPLWSVAVALITAILTGVVFGLLPALRAAGLDPVAALRHE